MRRAPLLLLLLVSAAGAYLVANAPFGFSFVYERVPADRLPLHLLVDSEPVSGVSDPRAVTQELMDAWNAIPQAQDLFGTASLGGPYNGSNVGSTFGVFTNTFHEVAFDDDGQVMAALGVGPGVLGITVKSVIPSTGQILDFVVVINTNPIALSDPGSGASAEQLFRATLIHELGHTTGLAHTPVGMVNPTTFGLSLAQPSQIPTMYPFRLPISPQEGITLEQDDKSALIRSYPGDTSGLGSISGSVRAISGAPINELAVRAVGPEGGVIEHVGVLTNGDGSRQGRFKIENLPPGGYRVLIEGLNGRGSIDAATLSSGTGSLGSNPFEYAVDEYWQPGDGYDPALDDPVGFSVVQVRAGRDTGSVDFVLNGAPIFQNDTIAGSLANGDAQVSDPAGGFHFADYYVFQGSAGQNVTITATGGIGPQLRLLRPSDLVEEDSDEPLFGATASIARTLAQSGVYTIVLFSRSTTGNPGGKGNYDINLQGAGAGLPPPAVPQDATASIGSGDPGSQQFNSPICSLALMQVRVRAPSHEQLWIDRVDVNSGGSGDEAADVTGVKLVRDLNGDGIYQGGEPVLAERVFASDDGAVSFDNLDLTLPASSTADLLVVYDVTVTSVSSAAQAGPWLWAVPALLLLLWLRPRRATLLLLLVLVPLSCGGGGDSICNRPFNPAGAVVTFTPRIQAGDIVAFTATGGVTPFDLVTSTLQSGTLSVSN